jgi:diguanylate cyclase (GGDEF)-like protein
MFAPIVSEFVDALNSDDEKNEMFKLLKEALAQVRYYRDLMEVFERDALTGFLNANKYHEFLGSINQSSDRVCIVMFDVNDLKACNDTMGHRAGDLLLQKAAESMREFVMPGVKLYRIGGDEFSAVCVNVDEEAILERFDIWQAKLDEMNKRPDGIPCHLAAGMAYAMPPLDLHDVIARADKEMYERKAKMKSTPVR